MLSFQSLPTSSKGPLDLSRFLRGVTKTVLWQIKDTNPGHKVDQIPREYRSQRQGHLEVCLPFCWDTCRFSSWWEVTMEIGVRHSPRMQTRNVFCSLQSKFFRLETCRWAVTMMISLHANVDRPWPSKRAPFRCGDATFVKSWRLLSWNTPALAGAVFVMSVLGSIAVRRLRRNGKKTMKNGMSAAKSAHLIFGTAATSTSTKKRSNGKIGTAKLHRRTGKSTESMANGMSTARLAPRNGVDVTKMMRQLRNILINSQLSSQRPRRQRKSSSSSQFERLRCRSLWWNM